MTVAEATNKISSLSKAVTKAAAVLDPDTAAGFQSELTYLLGQVGTITEIDRLIDALSDVITDEIAFSELMAAPDNFFDNTGAKVDLGDGNPTDYDAWVEAGKPTGGEGDAYVDLYSAPDLSEWNAHRKGIVGIASHMDVE